MGNQKSKTNGADILYSDGTNCPDQDFGEYRGRIGKYCNGTLFIKNLLPKDAGWYRSHCDMKPEPDFYLLKLVDPVCNISIALIPSENDVQLQCKSTGNKNYKVFWTHTEQNLTGYEIFPGNLSVPRDKACGYFQCNILCGVLGLQKTGINLTYSDCKAESDKSVEIGLGLGVGVTCPVLLLIGICCYWKRRGICERINDLRSHRRDRNII